VFVAMGSPKQEYLMEKLHQKHKATYQGLGGSFDVYTGAVKRAPKWWLENNLEWAFRLFKEPSRIKRQIHLIRFLILLKFKGI
jgi:UDP-N-acetyl-D-mannosaminouronate:lipid I N-acetyl-D-mannosaminouronosyltransferase